MKELLGSRVKEQILLYLGSRGGTTGRRLAALLNSAPTPVFKALHQLEKAEIVTKFDSPPFYALNPNYTYYDELAGMIGKKLDSLKRPPRFLPSLQMGMWE